MLFEFMDSWSLAQEVKTSTRDKNILDVILTNDVDLIENIEVFENLQISDHKFVTANLSKPFRAATEDDIKVKNHCSTSIPKYNLYKSDPEAWNKAREQFSNLEFNLDDDPESLASSIISSLEAVVIDNFAVSAPPDRSGKRSNNLIPREVHRLMRQKISANRTLSKSSDEAKIQDLKEKIFKIEDDLRKLVHKRRIQAENKARNNLKTNPLEFFALVKKLTKKSAKVGPFKRDKDTLNLSDAEILSKQYSKVFTTPDKDFIFDSSEEFFKSDEVNDDLVNSLENNKNQKGKGEVGSTGNALPPSPPPPKK